jgi:acetyl-CoA acyltransferase 1
MESSKRLKLLENHLANN